MATGVDLWLLRSHLRMAGLAGYDGADEGAEESASPRDMLFSWWESRFF
jgi:hypothetical protein